VKIIFVPTKNPKAQGDLLELSILHGLRAVLGANCIDFPKKKVMYHDFSESPKSELHGRGFSLLTDSISDLTKEQRQIKNIDAIIYGCGILFEGEEVIGTQFEKCFKRELVEDNLKNVYPTGFGIPIERIMPINLEGKAQLFQKTAPDDSLFKDVRDFGGGFKHHIFTEEKDYYNDLAASWFGLSCKKGGWDCLRHYEIIAAGSVLLFKDYDKKPKNCSPQHLPCISYSTKEELENITNSLIINEKPTKSYMDLLLKQRQWLYDHGTTTARALEILRTINVKL
jgi:hypothetical protein